MCCLLVGVVGLFVRVCVCGLNVCVVCDGLCGLVWFACVCCVNCVRVSVCVVLCCLVYCVM